jgi:hypothetical protein
MISDAARFSSAEIFRAGSGIRHTAQKLYFLVPSALAVPSGLSANRMLIWSDLSMGTLTFEESSSRDHVLLREFSSARDQKR